VGEMAMPYRRIEFQAGEYYHIYHRGQDRQKIFFENENYLYFTKDFGIRMFIVIVIKSYAAATFTSIPRKMDL
jgi:hypothetical protein